MSQRTPEQVRMFDLIKAIVAGLLLLLLIMLLVVRFVFLRPAPTAPTIVPTATLIRATTANIEIPTSVPTATSLPTSPPTATVTLVPSPIPTATEVAKATPTNTQLPTAIPLPTNTLAPTNAPAPTLTSTPVVSGTLCPPYGARGEDLGATYITVYCDTLSNIAERTGVSLQALINANPQIPDPNLIFSGNVVVIPAPRK